MNLITLPTNDAGESWTDAIREIGQRYSNTPEQIEQAVDRAQALVSQGSSPARAIGIVRATLKRWGQIRGDDATFQQRRATLARASRFWVQPA